MKGVFSAPGDYIYFKSQVPLHKIPIGSKQWRYYDFGPKVVPPLICIPGTGGTADVYYKQIMSLSMKGYRVISVDIPHVWNHHEWIQAFEKFLDAIDVHHIHLYGTSLGGFLAQLFAQHRPRRVRSLILSNSFLETRSFSAAMPWAPIVGWTPSFLLKRYVLTGIRDGPHEPFIADSVDFVVSQVETLSREDLASRLTLTVDDASVEPLLLSDSFITLMDTNDYCAIPQQLKDQVSERYPGARQAYLKTGGDFPFLSRPDEVNLHLQLHLRRVGIEARPDLVHGISNDGGGGSSSKQNDEREDADDAPEDDMGSFESPSTESQPPPPPENTDSHNLDDQLLSNAKVWATSAKLLTPLLRHAFFETRQRVIITKIFLHLTWEFCILYLLPLYMNMGTLYINWKYCWKIRLVM
uniref:Maspardin n=1 Tax=Davidia involucrata TaxID=16924 RepID=A0A5B6ZTG9_DAVIN